MEESRDVGFQVGDDVDFGEADDSGESDISGHSNEFGDSCEFCDTNSGESGISDVFVILVNLECLGTL